MWMSVGICVILFEKVYEVRSVVTFFAMVSEETGGGAKQIEKIVSVRAFLFKRKCLK